MHENFRAYGVGTHRHAPEIHQAAETDRIVFVPHLLPLFRGILSTIYLTPDAGVDALDLGLDAATLTLHLLAPLKQPLPLVREGEGQLLVPLRRHRGAVHLYPVLKAGANGLRAVSAAGQVDA